VRELHTDGELVVNTPMRQVKLTGQEALGYLLAFLGWAALAAGSGLALLTLRSAVAPAVIAVLFENPYYQSRFFRIGGIAGVADGISLGVVGLLWIVYVFLLEDFLRTPVSEARAERIRAASAGNPAGSAGVRPGLVVLARRVIVAAIFPAATIVVYLLLQGVMWLLLRR
jgi:hypothetical protein